LLGFASGQSGKFADLVIGVPDNYTGSTHLPRGGASWSKFPALNERPSSNIIKQLTEHSCGAACAQTLLREADIHVSQSQLASTAGMNSGRKGIDVSNLADAMNQASSSQIWRGGYIDASVDMINTLNNRGSWIALLSPKSKIGHYVIVDGVDDIGNLAIRDPRGLEYSLSQRDFLDWWTEQGGYGGAIF
jgi:filamentous hemagglutinin